MWQELKTLCALSGTSGMEDAVRAYILEQAQPHADKIETDAMGNIMVLRKGKNIKPTGKTVMLAAHMDEVGVICKSITDEGMIKFGFVGGVDPRVTIGRRVLFGETRGVIGIKAVHLTTAAERKTMPKAKDLYIDIGADSKSMAEKQVQLGDYGVFDSEIVTFGDGLLKAKAIDDRFGCAVLLKLLREQPPLDTWFCFTVQEEVGTRGATIVANRLKPQICLVLEGTTAADLAEVPPHKSVCCVRGGAVIPFMDRATIYDADLFALLRGIAQKQQIKWQTKHMVAGGTDAGILHKAGTGAKTAALAVPVRYIHSPSSVAAYEDMEGVLKLAHAFLEEIEHVENI